MIRSWVIAVTLPCFLALPSAALAQNDDWGDDWDEESNAFPIDVHGFAEGALGTRVVSNEVQSDDMLLEEARLRLEFSHQRDLGSARLKLDLTHDGYLNETRATIREAAIFFQPADSVEIEVGRQILTWGTGDLLFLNDLFPKDFVSFFIGRADEYLKAPSDALKLSFFGEHLNLNLVWTPVFDPDEVPTGERLSFFNPMIPGLQGENTKPSFRPLKPDKNFKNGEFALRLYQNVRGIELAFYAYRGFWKDPIAVDPGSMRPTYARMASLGASARGTLWGGIANFETSFYDSFEDMDGTDPNIPNSQMRGLVGFEREALPKFTIGVQYYVEYTLKHRALLRNSPNPAFEPDETRHLFTARFTYLTLHDDLTLSLFAFGSPSDRDGHLRPVISYKWTDAVELVLGANLLFGDEDHTFFASLEDNTNIYTRVRYSF